MFRARVLKADVVRPQIIFIIFYFLIVGPEDGDSRFFQNVDIFRIMKVSG